MGGKSSKPDPPTCVKCCRKGYNVSNGGDYKGMCESCVRNEINTEAERISQNKSRNEMEQRRLMDELERKRQEANLELQRRTAEIKMEEKQKEYELNRKEQLDKIELFKKQNQVEYERAKNLDEKERQAIERDLKKKLSELESEKVAYELKHQKAVEEDGLETKKKLDELELQLKRHKEMQAARHLEESHQLDQELKKDAQKHQQKIEEGKLAIEADFSKRVQADVKLMSASGAECTLRVTDTANAMLLTTLVQAIQAPPSSGPNSTPKLENNVSTEKEGKESCDTLTPGPIKTENSDISTTE